MIRRCLTPAAWLALACGVCAGMAEPSTDDLYAQEDVLSAEQRQWLADQNTAIRIGVTTIPPQVFVDSRTGQLRGLCIDFIQEMERILGYRFEVVFFDTWNAMMEAAFLRDIDVVYAAQRTPSREAAFLFTDSYLVFENKIVTTIDVDGPLTMADLKDKTVTVVRGAAIEEHLKLNYPAIQLMPVDDELIGLTRVSFNQAEAMVIEIARASWYIQQKKFTNLHIAGDTGYIYELGFACRSDWPELRDLLNAGLRSIPPARQAELTHRWILPTGRDEPNVWIWLAVAGGLAAALLAVFGWNRLLSLQVRRRTAELEQELDAHEKDLAALKRYETSMQRLFGNLRGIAYRCRYERDWPMEFISAGCEEMTGYADQAFYGGTTSWGDLIVEKDRDFVWDEITQGLEKKEAFQVEYRIRDRSGQIKWFWEKGCGVYDPTGQVISMEGFITDITDRKQAEEAYRESEEHLRSLFVASPAGIGLVKDRILLSVNERTCKMTGYTSDELVGQNSRMLYPTEEEYRYVGEEKYRLIELCGIGTVETRWRRKDGTFIDVLLSSAPLNQEHRDKGTTFTAMDITDRKAAEKALQDSEYRYRELIDLAVDGILLGDHDGHIIEANSFMLTLTGKPRDDLVGRHIAVLFEPEVLKQTPLRFDLLQRGHVVVSERAIRRTDGATTLVEMRTKMMPDGSYQSILRDITNRKHSEQVREDLLKELGRKNEELESIVFIASHDLRGPLVNIRGFAGELNKSIEQIQEVVNNAGLHDELLTKLAMPLERDIPESLQFIDASSQKMEMLLNGLLRLSRIGTAQINPTAINMEQLIGGIIGGLEFKIRQSNIDIAVEGSVPPCRGDLTLINQVFSNLVDNAIKYRHPERPCRIRIRGRAENGRSLYEVEDNGIGIAAEHQKKIFEIFYQLKPGSGGDGLGLTIVRRVLERQNGTIEIVSEVGAGTTVCIALPSE